jgi:hypothetical protein
MAFFCGTSRSHKLLFRFPIHPFERLNYSIQKTASPRWTTMFDLDYEMSQNTRINVGVWDEVKNGPNKTMGSAVRAYCMQPSRRPTPLDDRGTKGVSKFPQSVAWSTTCSTQLLVIYFFSLALVVKNSYLKLVKSLEREATPRPRNSGPEGQSLCVVRQRPSPSWDNCD